MDTYDTYVIASIYDYLESRYYINLQLVCRSFYEGFNVYCNKYNEDYKLLPHQIAHFNNLIHIYDKYNYAIDASDVGLGKTYIACAIAKKTDRKLHVICSASLKTKWEKVSKYFNIKDVYINTYNKIGRETNHYNNYNRYSGYDKDNLTDKDKLTKIYKSQCNNGDILLVFDEFQTLMNCYTLIFKNSLNISKHALLTNNKLLFISATPAANISNFLELIQINIRMRTSRSNYSTCLAVTYDYFKSLNNRGILFNDFYDNAITIIDADSLYIDFYNIINTNIITDDVLSVLHPVKSHESLFKKISARILSKMSKQAINYKYVDISYDYYDYYFNLDQDIQKQVTNHVQANAYIPREFFNKYDYDYDYKVSKCTMRHFYKILKDSYMTKKSTYNMRMMLLMEKVKLNKIYHIVNRKITETTLNKTIIFCNFSDNIEYIHNKIKQLCKCEKLSGQVNSLKRSKIIDEFQKPNHNIQVLICSTGTCSTGIDLHDLDGNFERDIYIILSQTAIKLLQTIGRTDRVGSLSKSNIHIMMDYTESIICPNISETKLPVYKYKYIDESIYNPVVQTICKDKVQKNIKNLHKKNNKPIYKNHDKKYDKKYNKKYDKKYESNNSNSSNKHINITINKILRENIRKNIRTCKSSGYYTDTDESDIDTDESDTDESDTDTDESDIDDDNIVLHKDSNNVTIDDISFKSYCKINHYNNKTPISIIGREHHPCMLTLDLDLNIDL
jgi:superfamily II DNA or RNA helicase